MTRLELHEAERGALEADIARRRAQLGIAEISFPAAMPEAAPEPGAYECALEETIRRRIDAAGVQTDAARLAEREFIIAVVGQAIGEALEEVHQRIDRLEHDNLQMRGMLHEHGLAVRPLLPDPADEYAPRTPGVLARAASQRGRQTDLGRQPIRRRGSTNRISTPMLPDERQAFIRRSVRAIMTKVRIIGLQRLAARTAEAYARGNGSEAELAALLVRENALEAARMRGIGHAPDAAA